LPVHVGLERSPRRVRVPGWIAGEPRAHRGSSEPRRIDGGELAAPHGGRVHLDGAAARRVLLIAAVLHPRADGGLRQGMSVSRRSRRSGLGGVEPLSPQKRWRAIILATLVSAPAGWSSTARLVA